MKFGYFFINIKQSDMYIRNRLPLQQAKILKNVLHLTPCLSENKTRFQKMIFLSQVSCF